ncbi:hypothetical protein [Oricola sp.]|uniref:hypothetical protein n=1 Tax=Oricola sp. TaxID=1979950 RepID=UPI003BA8F8A6
MNTTLIARNALAAAILIPMIVTAGVVITTEPSFAQQSSPGGGNNGGRGDRGGDNDRGGEGSSALDFDPVVCAAAPCPPQRRPPRRKPTPVQSVSIAPDCSCEMRTVSSGGQLIRIKDCYKVVHNRVRYCQPLAQ